jgi:hypothetical protein
MKKMWLIALIGLFMGCSDSTTTEPAPHQSRIFTGIWTQTVFEETREYGRDCPGGVTLTFENGMLQRGSMWLRYSQKDDCGRGAVPFISSFLNGTKLDVVVETGCSPTTVSMTGELLERSLTLAGRWMLVCSGTPYDYELKFEGTETGNTSEASMGLVNNRSTDRMFFSDRP